MGRAPLVHTPLQTTGHNCKPSVSLTPAVLASLFVDRQKQPNKRKIVVALPQEDSSVARASDEDQLRATVHKVNLDAGKDEETARQKAQQAVDALKVRKVWKQRSPRQSTQDQLDEIETQHTVLQQHLTLLSAPQHPEPWPVRSGLPDIIDVYLPGQSAWIDCRHSLDDQRPQQGFSLRESNLLAHDRGESTSSALRVREYLAVTAAQDVSSNSTWSHRGQTMSLSMPVSGDNFATGALSALGLGSSEALHANDDSSSDDSRIRAKSAPDAEKDSLLARPAHLQELRRDSAPASLSGTHASKPSLKVLGAGFGYEMELEDVAEEDGQERDIIEEELRTNPSEDADASDQREEDEDQDLTNFDEATSDVVADKLRSWRPRQPSKLSEMHIDQSFPQSAVPNPHNDTHRYNDNDTSSADNFNDYSSEEQDFSNPSDELAARRDREERRALRAEQRAAAAIARLRARDKDHEEAAKRLTVPNSASIYNIVKSENLSATAIGRPRADTADTYASSSLHPENEGGNQRLRPEHAPGSKHSAVPEDEDETGTFGDPLSDDDDGRCHRSRRAEGEHFRLPSIKHSSFGSSAFEDADDQGKANEKAANTIAETATSPLRADGNLSVLFTFTLPSGAPTLPELDPIHLEQGREKRYRLEQPSSQQQDENVHMMDHMALDSITEGPPCPKASLATIEDGLREANVPVPAPSNPRELPPIFAPPSSAVPAVTQFPQMSRSPVNSSSKGFSDCTTSASLRPSAPSFLPTWSKTAHASSSRPSMTFLQPDGTGLPALGPSPNFALRVPSSDFTFTVGSKAIPIRRPGQPSKETFRELSVPGTDFANVGHNISDNSSGTIRERSLSTLATRSNSRQTFVKGHSPARERRHDVKHGKAASIESVSQVSDSESLSEFVEELAARLDDSLEAWAGKILDEVTLAGQVRPAGPTALKMEEQDRQLLVSAIAKAVDRSVMQRILELQNSTLEQQRTLAIDAASRSAAAALAITDGPGSPQSPKMALTTRATRRILEEKGALCPQHRCQPPLADDEADFDYVVDTLDMKLSGLKRELIEALNLALPRVLQQAQQDGHASDGGRLGSGLSTRSQQPDASALAAGETELIAKVSQKVEEWLQRTSAGDAQDRQNLKQSILLSLDAHISEWGRSLAEMRETIGERIEVVLVNTILPHLDVLLSTRGSSDNAGDQARAVAVRVTEMLVPVIQQTMHSHAGIAANGSEQALDKIADAVSKRVLPLLSSLKFVQDHTQKSQEHENLIAQLSDVIRKNRVSEATLDLDPITALLEPLVAKQDAVRSTANKLLEKHREMERLVATLPTAIGAKIDFLFDGDQDRTEYNKAIQTQLGDIAVKLAELRAREHTVDVEQGTGSLMEEYRRQAEARKVELDNLSGELNIAKSGAMEVQVDLARVQQTALQAEEQVQRLRKQEAALLERVQAAELKAVEAERKTQAMEAARERAEKQNETLQAHIDQLANELHESRQERARERESAAQATAELLVRLSKAEGEIKDIQERAEASQKRKEREHLEAVERAALAEGELQAMLKRITDQDTRVANLQTLTATQKQRAAEAQQKLAEAAKRTKEYETQCQELAVALTKLEAMESRLTETQRTEEALREADEEKSRLREELSQYHDRFLELEHDLVGMKERFVEREDLEARTRELAASREVAELLKSQLAERDRRDASVLAHANAVLSPTTRSQHTLHLHEDSPNTGDSSFDESNRSSSSMWASGRGVEVSEGWESPATHLERSASGMVGGGPRHGQVSVGGVGVRGVVGPGGMVRSVSLVPMAGTPMKHHAALAVLSGGSYNAGNRGPLSATGTATSQGSSGDRTSKTVAQKTSDGWWT